MDVKKMLQLQKKLDDRIRNEHQLNDKNVINEKIVAFQVELGELANETRCFKYWSKKPASSLDVILEEYVDGVHFLLSIALDLGVNELEYAVKETKNNIVETFKEVFEQSAQFSRTKQRSDFLSLWNIYFSLGSVLGFSSHDIETAYIGKNEVNHQRQDEGY